MAHLPFGIHRSSFGPGQRTHDLQLLHFTLQVNAPPVCFLLLCQSSPIRFGHRIIRVLCHPGRSGHRFICVKCQGVSKKQRRNCPKLRTNDLVPLTAPSLAASLLVPFSPSHFTNLCFLCTSSNASLVFCSSSSFNFSMIISWYFSGATFCMLILPSIREANTSRFSLKCSQLSLKSRHTSDSDLVRSSSAENLEQLFAFLTSRLPRNAYDVNTWLIWRQNLVFQFCGTYFQGFAFLPVLQQLFLQSFGRLLSNLD